MVGKLLLRGMIVGVIAGLVAFVFARIFGEPQVDAAIGFEEMTAKAAGEAAEPELVSRATQAGLGLITGLLVYGAALGGLFALVFAYVHGRVGRLGPRATAGLLALAGFVAIVVVPGLKYPATPPAVGDPETIAYRTELFFLMIVLSLAAMVIAIRLALRLQASHGAWNGGVLAALAYMVLVAVLLAALPALNEVPENFPAAALYDFRLASLGIHAILWTIVGLGFGYLAEPVLAGRRAGRASGRLAAL